MMKRVLLFSVVALAAVCMGAPVYAQSQLFNASVMETGTALTQPVYQRYWSADKNDVNIDCGACTTQPCNLFDGQNYCQLTFAGKTTKGYKGYDSDLINWVAPFGTVFNSVVEMEANTGAGNHAGYYVWAQGAVNDGDFGFWSDAGFNCASTTVDVTCLGNGNVGNSVDVSGVPTSSGGPILNNVGGFRPTPVPRAFDIDGDGNAGTKAGVKGFYQLSWDAAASIGKNSGLAPAGYEIWAAKSTGSSGSPGSCTPPTQAAFLRVAQVPATPRQAEITDAQLASAGVGPLGPTDCVTFALKIRFGATANSTAIVSRYVSANGQSFFGTGGLSASVYELVAKYAGKNNVNVTWKTSLEDGVRGFYVSRATAQNGEYTRVSDLISAKGEPSAYSFIDTIQAPAGNVKAAGLWYKVETIDIDDNAVEYGPTKAQLPGGSGNAVIKQRTAKPQR